MGLSYQTEACKSSVELWIAYLKKEGFPYSTVVTHISALLYSFRKLDLKVTLDSDRLKMMLKGLGMSLQQAQKLQCLPVICTDLTGQLKYLLLELRANFAA